MDNTQVQRGSSPFKGRGITEKFAQLGKYCEEENISFGRHLDSVLERYEAKISIKVLAKKSHVSESSISRFRHNIRFLKNPLIFLKLADTIVEILGQKDDTGSADLYAYLLDGYICSYLQFILETFGPVGRFLAFLKGGGQ